MAFRHWDNLSALYAAKTNSTEDITAKAETSKQNQQEALEKQGVYVRPPSIEEMEGLINGNISVDDFKSQLGLKDKPAESAEPILPAEVGEPKSEPEAKPEPKPQVETETESESEKDPNSAKPEPQPDIKPAEQPNPVPPEPAKPTAQELLDAAVRELYTYEAELLSKLGEMKSEALEEYRRRGAKREDLIAVGMEGLDKCYALEAEADVKVRGVLDKLKAELEAIGVDSGITKELWEFYCDEKANSKAYYLNKYL